MFHCHGHRFTNFMELQQKVRLVVTRWRNSLASAIIRYAEECSVTGRTPVELNGKIKISVYTCIVCSISC